MLSSKILNHKETTMKFEIFINGIKIDLSEGATLKDVMDKFFRSRCEFLISLNSESIKTKKFDEISLKENDNLQIVAYSRHSYSPKEIESWTKIEEKEKGETK